MYMNDDNRMGRRHRLGFRTHGSRQPQPFSGPCDRLCAFSLRVFSADGTGGKTPRPGSALAGLLRLEGFAAGRFMPSVGSVPGDSLAFPAQA